MPADVPHFHVEEQTAYVEYLGLEGGDQIDSSPAYTGEEAAKYIQRRAPRVGVDLEISIDRFELDEEADERTFEMASWTIRICFLETCESQEEFGQFMRIMTQVEEDKSD